MLIAQITDIHLGFERDNPGEMNRQRLDAAVRMLSAMDPRPDLLLCTGDLTDRGDEASYERLREALSPLPFPWFLAVGNHDLRGPLLKVFPEVKTTRGFVQYAIEGHPVRILVLDTLEEHRHAGAFGPERGRWLEARLKEQPDKPTLIALHHPPVVTGIDWMTLTPQERWPARLAEIVGRHKNIVALICGHMHRPIMAPFAGTTLRACPSTAPQVVLDLKPMDLDHPDDRPLIQEEPPAYALHWWTPGGLISHFGRVENPTTLLRFDGGFQPVLKHFDEERWKEPAYPGEAGPGARDPLARLFSFAGRSGRVEFWIQTLALTAVWAAIMLALSAVSAPLAVPLFTLPLIALPVTPAMLIAKLAVLWSLLAVAARRQHDRGRNAWWLLILFAPIVGALYWIIELGCRPGDPRANPWGGPVKA